jgi:hypothetical protein
LSTYKGFLFLKNTIVTHKKSLRRKRKCRHCKELFIADYRNIRHQRYCTKDACVKASKASSQQKWLFSSKGENYFKDPCHSVRVKEWRKHNSTKSKKCPFYQVLSLDGFTTYVRGKSNLIPVNKRPIDELVSLGNILRQAAEVSDDRL